MGSHQSQSGCCTRRAQGRVPLPPSPSLSLPLPHSPSLSLPPLPTLQGGALGGQGQGWEGSEGTVSTDLGASYLFCFITSDPKKGWGPV